MKMNAWSGIDVGKQSFEASWVTSKTPLEEFHRIPHREFSRTQTGVGQFLEWLKRLRKPNQPVRIIMEATGRYSLELHSWLVAEEPELAPAIVNPKQALHFHKRLGLRNKTDAVDARSLGLMGRERKPRAYQPLAPEYRELRELMRQRRVLVQTLVAEQDRLQKIGESKSVRRLLKSHINHLEKLLIRVQKATDRLLAESPHLVRIWLDCPPFRVSDRLLP
jgi:transposase